MKEGRRERRWRRKVKTAEEVREEDEGERKGIKANMEMERKA